MSQYLLIPRSAPDAVRQLEIFNKGLERLRATGLYDAIVGRHLGAS